MQLQRPGTAIGLLLSLVLGACESSVDAGNDGARGLIDSTLVGTRQLSIVSGPTVQAMELPWRSPTAPPVLGLAVSVVLSDSSAAINGWTSTVLVESDRGDRQLLEMAPSSCIARAPNAPSSLTGPRSFEWFQCDHVNVATSVVLTSDGLARLMADAGAIELLHTYQFQSQPGAYYTLRTRAMQDPAASVRSRVRAWAEVTSVDRFLTPPACVASLDVPPPSCPPWSLIAYRPFAFGNATSNAIAVSHGGWVRATYRLADGSSRVAELRVP